MKRYTEHTRPQALKVQFEQMTVMLLLLHYAQSLRTTIASLSHVRALQPGTQPDGVDGPPHVDEIIPSDGAAEIMVTMLVTVTFNTWTASPGDPGCVTAYEISRATSAGGAGATVGTVTAGTVTAGTVTYNDSSATTGTTYYYKIRAVAGSEYSPYTAEVSGKKL